MIGGTAASVAHALLIAQWSADVVYFPHTRSLTADEQERLDARGVRVHPGEVSRLIVEADRLQGDPAAGEDGAGLVDDIARWDPAAVS